MSGGAAQRRQRILAVRVRQTRIAQVRLAKAIGLLGTEGWDK